MTTPNSYAQIGEDIRLWRALSHVRRGTYIDIGAHDPEFHSLTKLFYDRGWSGIDVEPLPSAFERIERARTRAGEAKLSSSGWVLGHASSAGIEAGWTQRRMLRHRS